MKPKTINALFWIFTILFAALMIFSAVGGLQPSDQAVKMLHDGLGYPVYFIQFISFAKLAGSLILLIPSVKTLKEWAYAGLAFDLAGAFYSINASTGKFNPSSLGILLWIVVGGLSYYFWKKKIQR